MKKKPDNIILHVATNDVPEKDHVEIYNDLQEVIKLIHDRVPNIKNIVISAPIVRTDSKPANIELRNYTRYLKDNLVNEVIVHDNIHATNLTGGGIHLNYTGIPKLAENLLSKIRKF